MTVSLERTSKNVRLCILGNARGDRRCATIVAFGSFANGRLQDGSLLVGSRTNRSRGTFCVSTNNLGGTSYFTRTRLLGNKGAILDHATILLPRHGLGLRRTGVALCLDNGRVALRDGAFTESIFISVGNRDTPLSSGYFSLIPKRGGAVHLRGSYGVSPGSVDMGYIGGVACTNNSTREAEFHVTFSTRPVGVTGGVCCSVD